MTQNRDDLINQLATGLRPVKPLWGSRGKTLLWLLSSTLFVVLIMVQAHPFRANVIEQLVMVPRFALEILFGALAILVIGALAIRKTIPGLDNHLLTAGAIILTLLWVSNYVVGLFIPAMEESLVGKRPHCFWETIIYSMPTLLLGFWIANKGFVMSWPATGFALGLSAAFIPALLMQLACMYGAAHALMTHLLPALIVAMAGYMLGLAIQNRPQRV